MPPKTLYVTVLSELRHSCRISGAESCAMCEVERLRRVERAYLELMTAAGPDVDGETRHETALRMVREGTSRLIGKTT